MKKALEIQSSIEKRKIVNIEITKTEGIHRLVEVSFSSEDIAQERLRIMKRFMQRVQIPGFRAGKAPESLVENRYQGEIQRELDNALRDKALDAAMTKQDLDIFSIDSLNRGTATEGGGLSFRLELDVRPIFDLPDYEKDLQLPAMQAVVTDEDVGSVIETLRNQKAEYNEVARAAMDGDSVSLAYEGYSVDGTPLKEKFPQLRAMASQRRTWETAGKDESCPIAAIPAALVGLAKGDKKRVEMMFPADFPRSELAGQATYFELEVFNVREKILPALTEDFWRAYGAESETQLRERICETLKQGKLRQVGLEQRQKIVDFLEKSITFEIPRGALREEIGCVLSQLIHGVKKEVTEQSVKELQAQAEQIARQRIKMALIIEAVAKKEGVKLEDRDLNQLIYASAAMNKVKPADVVEVLKSDRHALTELRQRGLAIKTIDFLLRKLTKPEQEIDTEGQKSRRKKSAETQSSETEKIREESKTDNAEVENEETTQKPRRRGRPASGGRKEKEQAVKE